MTNCPNCGAVLSYEGGLHCDYCGAVFERPKHDHEEVVLYSDNGPYFSMKRMFERGLLSVNEVRELASPSDWPSPPALDTR